MTAAEAITKAGEIRPNALPAPHMTAYLLRLDASFARMMGVPVPVDTSTSRVLLMDVPDNQVYVDYLCACIDRESGESDLYVMDKETFTISFAEICAAWRREHTPENPGQWNVSPWGIETEAFVWPF